MDPEKEREFENQQRFDIVNVLAAADVRRRNQDRPTINLFDFACGLLRSGSLTRYVLRQYGHEPDSIFQQLAGPSVEKPSQPGISDDESGPDLGSGSSYATREQNRRVDELLARIVAREKKSLSPRLPLTSSPGRSPTWSASGTRTHAMSRAI